MFFCLSFWKHKPHLWRNCLHNFPWCILSSFYFSVQVCRCLSTQTEGLSTNSHISIVGFPMTPPFDCAMDVKLDHSTGDRKMHKCLTSGFDVQSSENKVFFSYLNYGFRTVSSMTSFTIFY